MDKYYTSERNTQMLLALMKAHGIRKVVVSPGTTNVCFVASLQQDSFFELYSSVDERSAAYIACGLAAESGEPVALSCTGATASRNYIPGLTEAFYRKLPVLAITSTQHTGRIGQHIPQVIDRFTPLNDIVKMSVQIPTIHDMEDEWACNIMLNKVLLELRHQGGGPVHINLTTTYSKDFTVKEIPPVRVINRICYGDALPSIPNGKIGIFVGSHKKWSIEQTKAVDEFCALYNGVVFCDHTSNYKGRFRVLANLICSQEQYNPPCKNMDVLIHIGDVSGAVMTLSPKQVWRVNPDGEVRDTFKKLRYIFEMEEIDFFRKYAKMVPEKLLTNTYINEWTHECNKIIAKVPELPFSNVWVAQYTISRLPEGCVLYLGILNSLRSWNFFESHDSILGYSNTGGFGIDGGISSLLGASLANRDKLFFGVTGDLAFFYDMNAIGNRHMWKNVRLIIVNNGRGTEFRNYNHYVSMFGDAADSFMAAAGHYGNQSPRLIKHYAQDLGFEYLSASNKEEYLASVERFIVPNMTNRPILFEIFTNSRDESDAIEIMNNLEISAAAIAKKVTKGILGESGVQMIKKIVKR